MFPPPVCRRAAPPMFPALMFPPAVMSATRPPISPASMSAAAGGNVQARVLGECRVRTWPRGGLSSDRRRARSAPRRRWSGARHDGEALQEVGGVLLRGVGFKMNAIVNSAGVSAVHDDIAEGSRREMDAVAIGEKRSSPCGPTSGGGHVRRLPTRDGASRGATSNQENCGRNKTQN